jgi:hypothetical protein
LHVNVQSSLSCAFSANARISFSSIQACDNFKIVYSTTIKAPSHVFTCTETGKSASVLSASTCAKTARTAQAQELWRTGRSASATASGITQLKHRHSFPNPEKMRKTVRSKAQGQAHEQEQAQAQAQGSGREGKRTRKRKRMRKSKLKREHAPRGRAKEEISNLS